MVGVSKLRLVTPAVELERSHASFISELSGRGEELVPWVLEEVGEDFRVYISWLEKNSRGIDPRPGFVPNSTLWLVDEADEILGVTNIRHSLTQELLEFGGHIGYGIRPSVRRQGCATEMLRLSLLHVRSLGVGDVRITCDKANIGSAKTIVRNGGVLDTEEHMTEHKCHVQRYWIRGPIS